MTALSRLKQDFVRIKKDPVPYIVAEPLPSNILEWHYVVTGPESSPYEGGLYHGKLVFPAEFPFKPPSIYMITPSGRFRPNTRLCLSISDYHPDTWNPAWSVATILTGLLSFMLERAPTMGSVETTENEKRRLAARSHSVNLSNKHFVELFPDLAKLSREFVAEEAAAAAKKASSSHSSSSSLTTAEGAARRQLERNNGGGDGGPAGGGGGGIFQGAATNLLVMCGFLAFSFVVRHVLNTIAATGPNNATGLGPDLEE